MKIPLLLILLGLCIHLPAEDTLGDAAALSCMYAQKEIDTVSKITSYSIIQGMGKLDSRVVEYMRSDIEVELLSLYEMRPASIVLPQLVKETYDLKVPNVVPVLQSTRAWCSEKLVQAKEDPEENPAIKMLDILIKKNSG
jgi:hypothetical protein